MRFLALFSAAVVSLSQLGEATIIYSLSPASQSIVQGSVGLFNLSVRTDVAGGQQINGLEANVVSNAPNSFFTVASQTLLLNNGPIDRSTPGQAFISNFLPAGFSLGTTDTLFARLFLSTTNVATGPYTISLNQLAANSPTLAGLPVQSSGVVSYTVTAVPEPTSIALVALVITGLRLRRHLKCRQSV